jgi:tRNA (guanine-N7-)-methyltransferase
VTATDQERYPSGQREQTVNLPADAFGGSNPPLSITGRVDLRFSPSVRHSKSFPYQFQSRQEVHFYPVRSERIEADLLEIGPGKGEFLLARAKAHPWQRLVAIEISGERYTKLIRRVEAAGLTNVMLINGDARCVIPRLVPDASLQQIVVLFPDPWPKRRQAFQRLLTVGFLTELARSLSTGGEFVLKTDVESYAMWAVRNAAHLPLVTMTLATEQGIDPEMGETYYERRRRAAGCMIHTLRITRAGKAGVASAGYERKCHHY